MKKIVVLLAMLVAFVVSPAAAKNPNHRAAGIEAVIDVSSQRMKVYKRGRLLYTWKVSTGRRGYATPRGSYRPTRMHKMWYSRKYNMTPMPNSIFFRGGYAIHGTTAEKRLGRVASHGCVRLSRANAKKLFALVKRNGARNTKIRVKN